jgi:hypothetical protein
VKSEAWKIDPNLKLCLLNTIELLGSMFSNIIHMETSNLFDLFVKGQGILNSSFLGSHRSLSRIHQLPAYVVHLGKPT